MEPYLGQDPGGLRLEPFQGTCLDLQTSSGPGPDPVAPQTSSCLEADLVGVPGALRSY